MLGYFTNTEDKRKRIKEIREQIHALQNLLKIYEQEDNNAYTTNCITAVKSCSCPVSFPKYDGDTQQEICQKCGLVVFPKMML